VTIKSAMIAHSAFLYKSPSTPVRAPMPVRSVASPVDFVLSLVFHVLVNVSGFLLVSFFVVVTSLCYSIPSALMLSICCSPKFLFLFLFFYVCFYPHQRQLVVEMNQVNVNQRFY
jgi:hypothetical protein